MLSRPLNTKPVFDATRDLKKVKKILLYWNLKLSRLKVHFSMEPSVVTYTRKLKAWSVFPCDSYLADNPARACFAFHVLIPALIRFSGSKTATFSRGGEHEQ